MVWAELLHSSRHPTGTPNTPQLPPFLSLFPLTV